MKVKEDLDEHERRGSGAVRGCADTNTLEREGDLCVALCMCVRVCVR